ncbi:MAG TPA: TetR/AcrR family transcriptional regulator C-terminal domain-containing protein [Solirubrobacteraceae bacterium]|jgi:AcrR family transcriptional regulator
MPNRAPSELVWDSAAPDQAPPTRVRSLTREAIVAAAIAIADADGLDAVSIRRVAGDLGVRPMSLYTHIASKDDLLDLMVNEVIAEALVPEPLPTDWRRAVREIALRSHDAFVNHAWVVQAFAQRPRFGPNSLRHAEQSLAAVADLGLDERTAATLLAIVDEYALGHAMRTLLAPREDELRGIFAETLRGAPDLSEFPHLAASGAVTPSEDAFEIGLDALIEGLARTLVDP